MHSQKKKADRGDIRVVKVCPFHLVGYPSGMASPFQSYRCGLEEGHKEDHLIRVTRVADGLPSSLESKTEGGTHG